MELVELVSDLMHKYGYLALFLAVALEGTGMPGPIQVVFLAAGYMMAKGKMDFPMVVLVATLGNVVGNAGGYAIGAWGGRQFIRKYGKFFRVQEEHLKAIEAWFHRYGDATAFIARIFGIIRTPTILGAGIARMHLPKFLLFSGLGDFLWSSFWAYVGLFASPWVAKLVYLSARHAIWIAMGIGGAVLAALVYVSIRVLRSSGRG